MRTRRIIFPAILFLMLATGAQAKPQLSLKFFGGGGYWPTGGDFKELFQSTADRWKEVGYRGVFDLDWKPWAFEGGIQVGLKLTSRFGLSVGAGYLSKIVNQDSSGDFGPTETIRQINAFRVNAVPITLDAVYILLPGPFQLQLSAGAGYYSTRISVEEHGLYSEPKRTGQPNWKWDVRQTYESDRKGVFGLQAGIGAEVRLSDRIGLCLDALYRIASFDDVVGVFEWADVAAWTGGSDSEYIRIERAKMWYSQSTIWGQVWHYLDFTENKPTGSDEARPFKIDLGGPILRIGIRIRI